MIPTLTQYQLYAIQCPYHSTTFFLFVMFSLSLSTCILMKCVLMMLLDVNAYIHRNSIIYWNLNTDTDIAHTHS